MRRWPVVGAGGVLMSVTLVALTAVVSLSVRTAPVASAASIECTPPAGPPLPQSAGSGFHGGNPERLADTRLDGPVPAGCWLRVAVPASVPPAADAVVVTVTAVDAPEAGFLTVHPCDSSRPPTSNVNVATSAPVANLAVVAIGPGRELCVYSDRQSHVLVDLFGWFGPGGATLQPMSAVRALDTRVPGLRPPEIDGIVEPGERISLDRVALGAPPDATAVVVNFTVTDAQGFGFLSGFPCAGSIPPTSNVNFGRDIWRANTAIIALDGAGKLCAELGGSAAHVIVDVVASLGGDGPLGYEAAAARVADTRGPGGPWVGPFAAGETRPLDAIAHLPLGTDVAVIGVTATQAAADGFVQVRPCGTETATSSLNFLVGADVTNLVAVPVAGDGTICVTSSAPTHLVVDVFGGFGQGGLVRTFDVGSFELFPTFDPAITDYIAYCTDDDQNDFDITLSGPPGTTVAIVGGPSGRPNMTARRPVGAGEAIVATYSSPSGANAEYWVRCVPPDFPRVTVTRSGPTAPGWYLVANAAFARPPGEFAIILDSNGVPVWYRRTKTTYPNQFVADFKRLADGTLSWVIAPPLPFGLDPTVAAEQFRLDSTLVARHRTVDNPADPTNPARPLDGHDLVELSNGNLLMISYPVRTSATPYDCVDFGGTPTTTTTVLDAVIQEIDPTTGTLVREWSADVLGLLGPPKIDIGTGGPKADPGEVTLPACIAVGATDYYDPVHINGLDATADGSTVLFTARHLNAVYAVDWATGAVEWKLGGKPAATSLTIVGDGLGGPVRQHDVKLLESGNVSVFDNRGAGLGTARYAEYALDESARTATLVRSIDHPTGSFSGAMGSARRQPDGAVVVGWGALPGPVFTEFDEDGQVALQVELELDGVHLLSYRTVKEPLASFDIDVLRATAGR